MLSEITASKIEACIRDGARYSTIAETFGVTYSAVRAVAKSRKCGQGAGRKRSPSFRLASPEYKATGPNKDKIESARRMRSEGSKPSAIAKALGVTNRTVYQWTRDRSAYYSRYASRRYATDEAYRKRRIESVTRWKAKQKAARGA